MTFLTGPNVPMSNALSQLSRGNRTEPFGEYEGMSHYKRSAVEEALAQLAGLMSRFLGILETMVKQPDPNEEDDFMKGWGDDELDDLGP